MTRRSSTMTPQARRVAVAGLVGGIVTGSACDVTAAPLHNLAVGLLLGVPAGLAVWALLTVSAHALGGAR